MAIEARYKMSQARLDDLKKELNYLETVREREVSEQIKEARSFGDLSENSEYDEAKTEQGKLYSRIAEVQDLIDHAEIVETKEITNAVSLGSRVKVRCEGDDEDEEYIIVGSQEANPLEGRISDDSPFGRELMGHVVGDKITVSAPAGDLHFTILNIEKKN